MRLLPRIGFWYVVPSKSVLGMLLLTKSAQLLTITDELEERASCAEVLREV
jgi:hypothetical protein